MPNLQNMPGWSGAISIVFDSAGEVISPDSWPHTYSWNADGSLNYEEVTDGASTWRKTYTYASGQLVSESAWVKQ
jgi:YD repeat-containing protein